MSTLFLNRLRFVLSPDKVYSDNGNLAVYSSDASIYSVKPRAVVRVESPADIVKTINICREFGVPVTARAGATGLAGGAIGAGVILDFCAYDKKIRIDSQKRTARVASGVICDDLNRAASKYGLMFPPDPSSGDSCRIGGMLGNNSSGARTVRYGTTRQYTRALNIVTASGKQIFIEPLKTGSDKLRIFFRDNPEFEQVFNLIISHRDIILPKRRNVKKNSTGYDLWTFIDIYDEGYVDFSKLLVGSESTLCLFESADVILEELPPELFTCLLFFKRYRDIGKAIPSLLQLKPYSLEVADSNSMDLMGREKYGLPEDAAVMLLMQFSKKDSNEIEKQLSSIIKADELSSPPLLETNSKKQKALWAARKALLPILYLHHPKKKPLSFVEDACLPAEKLPEIFEFVEQTFKKHELMYGSFGHIGDGNIHIKPLVDASDATDREKMRLVSMEIYNEILRLGGVVSGEHADGRVRSPFLRQVYGDEVYEIFRQIKKILDPHGILNPGVKLTDNREITENIDSKRLNWNCSQCGKCVPYCPSFHARRSEIYSPRGRIKISNYPGTATEDQRESLETCINCKNCRIVCPANCDASTDSRYYKEEHRRFALEPMFIAMNNPGLIRKGAAMAAMGLPLFNNNRPLRKLIENLSKPALKLDKDATLPKPSINPFAVRFDKRITGNARVAYFYGCADGFLENDTAEKIVRVFDMMGTPLDIPEQVCCGVPAESYGFTEYSRQAAGYNIESLTRYDYIITGCGTCVLMLKDYPHLFKQGERLYNEAKKLAFRVYEASDFLLKYGDNLNSVEKGKITYHDSCHLRCAGTESEPRQFIKELGLNYVEMDYAERCCGFAGTHYFTDPHESSRIFDIKRKSLDESGAEIVASCCPTCILQFAIQQTNARSVHPVSLIETNGKRG